MTRTGEDISHDLQNTGQSEPPHCHQHYCHWHNFLCRCCTNNRGTLQAVLRLRGCKPRPMYINWLQFILDLRIIWWIVSHAVPSDCRLWITRIYWVVVTKVLMASKVWRRPYEFNGSIRHFVYEIDVCTYNTSKIIKEPACHFTMRFTLNLFCQLLPCSLSLYEIA